MIPEKKSTHCAEVISFWCCECQAIQNLCGYSSPGFNCFVCSPNDIKGNRMKPNGETQSLISYLARRLEWQSSFSHSFSFCSNFILVPMCDFSFHFFQVLNLSYVSWRRQPSLFLLHKRIQRTCACLISRVATLRWMLKQTHFDLNSHLLQRTGRFFAEINLWNESKLTSITPARDAAKQGT